jgi:hypothetical protein
MWRRRKRKMAEKGKKTRNKIKGAGGRGNDM